jgi:hypothetical protein
MRLFFAQVGLGQRAFGAAALCIFALVSPPSIAAPLDKAGCARLAQDMQNMKALDVDKLMENGPSWAVSHLPPSELGLIRQYIDLDEQMKFRCSAPSSLVHLKHLDEEDEEGANKPADSADTGAKKPQSGDGEEAPASSQKRKAAKAPVKERAARDAR